MKIRIFVANTGVILMLLLAFLSGYMKCENIPVYADVVDDDILWQPLNSENELVDAFQAYCKSRDLTIEGSVLDAVTTATTGSFNGICNKLGLDITALQADIKKSTDSNGRLQFLFNETGISAYNRIFAQFLQDNELSVGDNVDDKVIYNGDYLNLNGNGSFVYIADTSYSVNSRVQYRNNHKINSLFSKVGTYYIYDDTYITNLYSGLSSNTDSYIDFDMSGNIYQMRYTYYSSNNFLNFYDNTGSNSVSFSAMEKSFSTGNIITKAHVAIIKYGNDYYIGVVGSYTGPNYLDACAYCCSVKLNQDISTQNVNIFVTTNNNTINNNNYEGNTYTTINNEGDVNNYDTEDEPPVNPGGGGSGGDNNINIDFPNINFPNIPDINFQLSGLNTKFPFCIPFDMVALLQMLNAEPQAPRIQGDIPISSSITWHLDMDFEQFDWFATIMRGLEFVGFIFFLVGATINIAKG